MKNHAGKIAISCATSVAFIFITTVTKPGNGTEYLMSIKSSFCLVIIGCYFAKKWHDNRIDRFNLLNNRAVEVKGIPLLNNQFNI